MDSYKELEVWKKGVDLVTSVYGLSRKFPRDEQYGIISQIQRCAASIPANIAEGWGRGQTREYLLFLRISRGSLMELETHLIVAERLGYLDSSSLKMVQKEIEITGMMLNGLISSLKRKLGK